MIVPPWHAVFLRHPLSFWLATSSKDHIPEPFKCTGVKFEQETDIFVCFAPEKFTHTAVQHLAENPVIALVGVELHTYEGYQYKGPYISHRACTPDEIAFQHRYMKEYTDILESFGYSAQGFQKAYMDTPGIAITFRAKQVFDQSPKVGTGGEIITEK